MGWCDDMINVPPGGGGTYVGIGNGPVPGGGGGVGVKSPKKNPVVAVPDKHDDITYDQVKSPCLVHTIKNLTNKDFLNKINEAAKQKFLNDQEAKNLDFKEVSNIINDNGEPVHARTLLPYYDNDENLHVVISLNTSTLPGTTPLFQLVTIYHETMHAVFKLTKDYDNLSQKQQHEEMVSYEKVLLMLDVAKEVYGRKLTDAEVKRIVALWLYSASRDAIDTSNFQDSLIKWRITVDYVMQIGEAEEKVVKVTTNGGIKIKTIGGRDCNE